MKKTMLVVTDLGGFKAYRLDDGNFNRSPRLELLEEYTNAEAHDRLVDKMTDLSGRFPRTTAPGGSATMSDGERHNIQLESRKRQVRQLARRLNSLMKSSDFDRCFFAASREINRQLFEHLDAGLRSKIERNLPADLTKTDKSELLWHFLPPEHPGSAGLRPTV